MEENKKLIFFNLDGTLVDGMQFIYQHLWEYFGIDKDKTRESLNKYLAGELTYNDWVNKDISLLQESNATKQGMMDAILTLHPMQGAQATIRALQGHGYKVFAISGGLNLVVDAVYGEEAKSLFERIFINEYQFDESGKLAGATVAKYDIEHKADCVKDMAKEFNTDLGNCVFVGDNENDVEASLLCGTSIAFNSKSERLVEAATYHVESKDLFDILKFLT